MLLEELTELSIKCKDPEAGEYLGYLRNSLEEANTAKGANVKVRRSEVGWSGVMGGCEEYGGSCKELDICSMEGSFSRRMAGTDQEF